MSLFHAPRNRAVVCENIEAQRSGSRATIQRAHEHRAMTSKLMFGSPVYYPGQAGPWTGV
jgi:hypothetical protein